MEMNNEYRVTWFDKDSEKDCEIITFKHRFKHLKQTTFSFLTNENLCEFSGSISMKY